VVAQTGVAYKQNTSGFSFSNPWVIGGGVAALGLVVVLVARK
jgi:hypothetical protein